MVYKKIKPKKIYEQVAEELHELIRTGVLKSGMKLDSIQQLAENFQVGRSAIREALSALSSMGLVVMRQGEGTYINEFDASAIAFPLSTAILMNKKDIAHLLEVRKILEVGTVAAAATNHTAEDIDHLYEALEEMKTAAGNEELGEQADLSFHFAIARAANNPLLLTLMNQVSDLMLQSVREVRRIWIYSKEITTDRLYMEHAQILDTIVKRDPIKAQRLMLNHLDNVEDILTKYYKGAAPSK